MYEYRIFIGSARRFVGLLNADTVGQAIERARTCYRLKDYVQVTAIRMENN